MNSDNEKARKPGTRKTSTRKTPAKPGSTRKATNKAGPSRKSTRRSPSPKRSPSPPKSVAKPGSSRKSTRTRQSTSPRRTPSPRRSPSSPRASGKRVASPIVVRSRSPSPRRSSYRRSPVSPDLAMEEAILASYMVERDELQEVLSNYRAIAETPDLSMDERNEVEYKIQEHEAQLNSLNSRIEESLDRERAIQSRQMSPRYKTPSPRPRSRSPPRYKSPSPCSAHAIIEEQNMELEQAKIADQLNKAGSNLMAGIGNAIAAVLSSPKKEAEIEKEVIEEELVMPRSPVMTKRPKSPASPSLYVSRPGSPHRAGTIVMKVHFPPNMQPSMAVIRFPAHYTVRRLNLTLSKKFGVDMEAYKTALMKAPEHELVTSVYGTQPAVIRFQRV